MKVHIKNKLTMKNTIKLSILFIVLCIKSNGQTNISKHTFKNSIMYYEGKKMYSYKSNGEVILYNQRSEKNEIETKMIITTLEGNPLKIDTLNIDTLNKNVGEIIQGIGQYEKWIFKSSTTFHQNGKIENQIIYSNAGKTGKYTSYDKTGKIIEEGSFINNTAKDGEWIKYNENGKVIRKEYYENGTLVKKEYYENGVRLE